MPPVPPDGPLRGVDRDVAVALLSARRRLPYEPRCLDLTLAGQTMLRLRGLPGTVVIGLAPGDAGPRVDGSAGRWGAHAWLVGGTGVVTGGDEAAGHTGVTGFRQPASGADARARTTAVTRTLIRWLRTAIDPAHPATDDPASVVPGISADDVITMAARHRVVGELATVADALPLEPVTRERLTRLHRQEAQAALRVAAVTVDVVRILHEAGIPSLVFKGVVLALQSTGDIGRRGAGDIDVLVHPDDVERADRALTAAGAQWIPGRIPRPGSPLWPVARSIRPEAPYRLRGVDVDLHWRFDVAPQVMSIGFHELRARRDTVRIGSAEVPTLGPRDALLLTLTHGTKEYWRQLRWGVDAWRQCLATPDDEWQEVRRLAAESGCLPGLGVGLAAVTFLAGHPPANVRPTRRARRLADLAWAEAEGTAGVQEFAPGHTRGVRRAVRWSWTVAPGPAARWALARDTLVSTSDMARWPLPPLLVPLYVPLRPWLQRRRARAAGPTASGTVPP